MERKKLGLGIVLGVGMGLGYRLLRKPHASPPVENPGPVAEPKPGLPAPFLKSWDTFSDDLLSSPITGIRVVPNSFTATRILGQEFNEANGHSDLKGLSFATTRMHFGVIERRDGSKEYFGVWEKLIDGHVANQLLLSNATRKNIGLDSSDIWSDWGAIHGASENMTLRRGRHQSMGLAWEVFGRDIGYIRFLIGRDQLKREELSQQEPRPMVLAVARWINTPSGRSFIYDLPAEGMESYLLAYFLRGKKNFLPHLSHAQCYNPTVGIWVLGHLSPDVRKNWREKYGYWTQEEETRFNGSTQAPVQTLRFDIDWYRPEDGILNGRLVSAIEKEVDSKAQPFEAIFKADSGRLGALEKQLEVASIIPA